MGPERRMREVFSDLTTVWTHLRTVPVTSRSTGARSGTRRTLEAEGQRIYLDYYGRASDRHGPHSRFDRTSGRVSPVGRDGWRLPGG